jgi:hydroxymethylpyrimidine/phosphomethylpyrimidine kinase
MHTILSIAGLDPSGGAGVIADIKTIGAFGCYGIAVVTSLTYQSTAGVFGARDSSVGEVRSQLRPLLSDFDITAIKTGMLPTPEIVEEVARCLNEAFGSDVPSLVVDPVACSSSGYRLASTEALESVREHLFPIAAVVTPNWAEAALLTGFKVDDERSAEMAAQKILSSGPRSVVVTGGDSRSEFSTDHLIDAAGVETYRSSRIDSRNTHGTGCTFSTAIACLLALGIPTRQAISKAKEFVECAIRTAPGLGKGAGPLNHSFRS